MRFYATHLRSVSYEGLRVSIPKKSEKYTWKNTSTSLRGQWVNTSCINFILRKHKKNMIQIVAILPHRRWAHIYPVVRRLDCTWWLWLQLPVVENTLWKAKAVQINKLECWNRANNWLNIHPMQLMCTHYEFRFHCETLFEIFHTISLRVDTYEWIKLIEMGMYLHV